MQENDTNSWKNKFQQFISEYIEFDKTLYKKDKSIDFSCLKESIALLLESGIFIDIKDIRQQAMKDFQIIIPEEFFS